MKLFSKKKPLADQISIFTITTFINQKKADFSFNGIQK